MTCQQIKGLLSELQERALPAPQREDLEAHLSGCASCRTEHDRTKSLDGFLRDAVRVPEPAGDFWARQEAAILKTAARPAPRARGKKDGSRTWLLGIGLSLAAAAVVAVAVGLSIGSPPAPKDEARKDIPMRLPEVLEPEKKASSPGESRPESAFARTLPQPLAPSASVPSAVLPGEPDYVDRLAHESVEVGLAQTLGDRLLGLISAAGGRLHELKTAVAARKDVVAEDLAEAYTMIVREGMSGLLQDPEESAYALDDARGIARNYAAASIGDLKSLEAGAEGSLKTALGDALRATRELAGQ